MLFFPFFFINHLSPYPVEHRALSFGGWDQTAGLAVVLMGINWGAVEAKVLQNHSTGAGSVGKCVRVTVITSIYFVSVFLKKDIY